MLSLAERAAACRCARHLFVLQPDGSPCDLAWTRGHFDTITAAQTALLLPQERSASQHHALGLLGTMHTLVNHECPELLPIHGELRRRGAMTVYSLVDRGPVGDVQGLRAAVSFEGAVDAYALPDASVLWARLRGHGVPAVKLRASGAVTFA